MKKILLTLLIMSTFSLLDAKESANEKQIQRVCFTLSCCSVGSGIGVGIQVFSVTVCYEITVEGAPPSNITYTISNLASPTLENEYVILSNNNLKLLFDWDLSNEQTLKDFKGPLILPKGDYLINENNQIVNQ